MIYAIVALLFGLLIGSFDDSCFCLSACGRRFFSRRLRAQGFFRCWEKEKAQEKNGAARGEFKKAVKIVFSVILHR